jgi:hypothetical protein
LEREFVEFVVYREKQILILLPRGDEARFVLERSFGQRSRKRNAYRYPNSGLVKGDAIVYFLNPRKNLMVGCIVPYSVRQDEVRKIPSSERYI